ncbi:ChiA14 [Paenibacillus mucilaginosus 3016]|uniref:ChiA14 n=1 Tax=Paenibacillus mucilaginosus 3016 TaxID=1116391 RepID=H6NPU7_9BACL|nr:fibronectin type III domain-containing protein [Paenibacillus mucilaginosus]AFC33453.1 ChiA14 [Paenibacillus mucilaginosus 3016]
MLKNAWRVWSLVLMLLLLVPLAALAEEEDVSVGIQSADLTGPNLDQLKIVAGAYSPYEIKELTAEVGDRKTALMLSGYQWTGTISLEGLPKGDHILRVTAYTYEGSSAFTEQTVTLEGPTVIEITEPMDGTVIRNGRIPFKGKAITGNGTEISVAVAYTIDGQYHSRSIYIEPGKTAYFDASPYQGKKITFHFISGDEKAPILDREVYVEKSQRLTESLKVDGKLLDWNAERVLYKADGILHIEDRASGQVTSLPKLTVATKNEKLVGSGAIFEVIAGYRVRDPYYKPIWWNGSELVELAKAGAVQDVNGIYTAYFADGGLFILNTATGEKKAIPPAFPGSYYYSVLLNEDGSATISGSGLFRYLPDGSIQTLMEDRNAGYQGLLHSGNDYVYTDGWKVYRYDGQTVSVLKENDTIMMEAGKQYLYQNGWLAYIKKSATGSAQLFLRSPEGTEKQLTFLSSAPVLQALAEDGSVAYTFNYKTYIHSAQASKALEVSTSLGSTFHLPALGGWNQRLGSGLYQVLTGPVDLDNTPPAWPANGQLTVTDLTYKSVKLHWPAAADAKGVTGYVIYRDDFILDVVAPDTREYTTEVYQGQQVKLTVKAEDGAGNAGEALETSVTVPEHDYYPPEWNNGNELTVTDVTYTSAKLAWPAAYDHPAVLRYAVYRDDARIDEVPGDTTEYTATGLTPGTSYRFTIAAEDEFNQSQNNPTAVVTTPELTNSGDTEAPVWPEGSSLSVSEITYSSAYLNWTFAEDNAAVTSYELYRDGELVDSVSGDVYGYLAEGLASGRTYLFSVIAKDAAGHASTGNPSVSVTTAVYGSGGNPVPSATSLSLQAKPGFIDKDSVLEVYLKADQAKDLYSFLSKVQYDPSRLKLAQVLLHSEFGRENTTAVLSQNTSVPGQVKLTGTLLGSVPGRGDGTHLVILKFKTLQNGPSVISLLPGAVVADSQGRQTTLKNGSQLTVYVGGGDYDGDGQIGLSDLVLISRASGLSQGQTGFDSRFDINNDGKISASDVQYIAGRVGSV